MRSSTASDVSALLLCLAAIFFEGIVSSSQFMGGLTAGRSGASGAAGPLHRQWLPPPATPERSLGLRAQFVCGDHEYRVRFRVRNVDHPKIPPRRRLAQRDARPLLPRPVLQGTSEHIAHVLLADAMPPDVGFARLAVDVEPARSRAC